MQREYLFITIAAILYGLIITGGQFFANLGLSVYEISVYNVLFITIILLPVVLIKRKYLIKKDMIWFFIVYGFIGAIITSTQYVGVFLGLPVAVVALLLYSQPIWTMLFGRYLFHEKITKRKVIALIFAILGIFILLKQWDIASVGSIAGIISALVAGIFLSLWVVWGRKSGINKQHYITTTIGFAGFSVAWLLLMWPVIRLLITDPTIIRLSVRFPPEYLFYLVVFALIAGVIPHSLFYIGIKKIHASVAGILLLLEPVSAAILAAIFFAQTITINIIIGGSLILFSNYVVVSKK